MSIQKVRSRKRILDTLCGSNSVTRILYLLEKYGEFVPSKPCQRIIGKSHIGACDCVIVAQETGKSQSNLDYQGVANRMAETVVDHFEAIDVNK